VRGRVCSGGPDSSSMGVAEVGSLIGKLKVLRRSDTQRVELWSLDFSRDVDGFWTLPRVRDMVSSVGLDSSGLRQLNRGGFLS